MKALLITAGALALATTMSTPALAQQAGEQAAVTHSGGQCAFSKAMLQAKADGKQQQMDETKDKVDALIENALATARGTKVAGSPVKLGKGAPDG
ncbi:MAG: hypothetical protein OER92_11475 [Alphaproteobacteria bacterium]|nr:hypothetical protein [Alphaproteobacteria bacterium]